MWEEGKKEKPIHVVGLHLCFCPYPFCSLVLREVLSNFIIGLILALSCKAINWFNCRHCCLVASHWVLNPQMSVSQLSISWNWAGQKAFSKFHRIYIVFFPPFLYFKWKSIHALDKLFITMASLFSQQPSTHNCQAGVTVILIKSGDTILAPWFVHYLPFMGLCTLKPYFLL